MKGKLHTGILPESEYPRWSKFVCSAAAGSIYSLPEYLEILCEATGGRFRILSVTRGEEIHGGVALYEQSGSAGTTVSSRLLLYYNGLVLRDYKTRYPSECTSRHLTTLTEIEKYLTQAGYARLRLHNRHPVQDLRLFLANGWSVRPNYSYVVNVEKIDETWGRIEQNMRRLIKRAEEKGIVASEDDDFDGFFRLHLDTHHRKGAPLYLPKSQFKRYFEKLKAQSLARLYSARTPDGKVISSQLVLLGGHPVTHSVCAAADAEYLKTGATPFLRWKVFQALSAEGYAANDLTDAALNEVTRFKGQLGGDLVTNTVATRPDSRHYRFVKFMSGIPRKGRSTAGRIYRKLFGGEKAG